MTLPLKIFHLSIGPIFYLTTRKLKVGLGLPGGTILGKVQENSSSITFNTKVKTSKNQLYFL